jgi:hypothetical protein
MQRLIREEIRRRREKKVYRPNFMLEIFKQVHKSFGLDRRPILQDEVEE